MSLKEFKLKSLKDKIDDVVVEKAEKVEKKVEKKKVTKK